MDDLLALSPILVSLSPLLPLGGPAAAVEETQSFEIFVEADPARAVLDDVLSVALADLLALLGVEHGQFLLLDPFGVDLGPPGLFLLVGGADFDALALVVLLEGERLGFFGLRLDGGLFGVLCAFDRGGVFFGGFLDVLVLVELVLGVSDVAPSSAFFSGSVAA